MPIVSGKPYQSGEGSRRLFQIFHIDDLVPEDHLLRRISAVLDLDFIRDRVHDNYDQESTRGRPPWDPVLLYRMMLLGLLFDLPENRLEQEVCKRPRHAPHKEVRTRPWALT